MHNRVGVGLNALLTHRALRVVIWTPFKLTIFKNIARVPQLVRVPRRLKTAVKLVMAGKMPSQPRAPTNSAPSSRSATPKPYIFDKPANDHTISFRPRLSQKEYPSDCPPLNVRWYYAVDVGLTRDFWIAKVLLLMPV